MIERILVISKDFDAAGRMDYVKDLSFYMASRGIETHVVCYGGEDNDYDLGENLHVHQVKFVLGANNPYNWHMLMNNELKRRSRELMEKEKFDIIHCIDWITYPAAVGVSRMFERPFVITIRSTEKERGFSIPESSLISEMEWLSAYDASRIMTLGQTTYDILFHDYNVPAEKLINMGGKDNIFDETLRIYEDAMKIPVVAKQVNG
ncbi:MAG: glycosyltransferase [Candidatus Micrarchaeota archaeon]|nr:glycosyltransferase [Candidatus Micrarchaeota archaeon]